MLYDIGMPIGKRIKAARERLKPKMTQKALAEALDCKEQAVSGWEMKGGKPEFAKLSRLRQILRVTFVWLVEGGDTPPPDPDDPEVLLEDRMIKILRKERGTAA